jgi:hypothetical protein
VRCTELLVLHALLLCAACAPVSKLPPLPTDEIKAEQRKQQVAQLRSYLGQLSRLDNVAFQLRVANRDDCEDRAWAQIGLIAGTVPSLPRKFRSFSHEALAVSWTHATVLSIADNSPAAVAGIKTGDQLLTFNNEPIPRHGTAGSSFRSIPASMHSRPTIASWFLPAYCEPHARMHSSLSSWGTSWRTPISPI